MFTLKDTLFVEYKILKFKITNSFADLSFDFTAFAVHGFPRQFFSFQPQM